MVQTRRIGAGEIKLIWWFVAAVNEGKPIGQHEKHKFDVEFHSYKTVLKKLTFEDDQELVKEAIELAKATIR